MVGMSALLGWFTLYYIYGGILLFSVCQLEEHISDLIWDLSKRLLAIKRLSAIQEYLYV